MRLADIDPLPLTLIASLLLAVILLAIRIFVMQRVQQKRQRENRQETERLKSLVAAYRSLAGSFSPALSEHSVQIEETLADLVLFGSLQQVELAAQCATQLSIGKSVNYQPLVESLRFDLRMQLGLESIPASMILPDSGPSRQSRAGRGEGEDGRRGDVAGGAGGGAAGASGLSAGIIAAEVSSSKNPV